ncbi:MAG: DUF4397 domain-containing protein [Chloroflexota bacterium]|nr:DUF4397 domain-containing protein [Chloroflexota bacterium]
MSPDLAAVDVLIDGQRAVAALPFKSASPYTQIPAGTRSVRVTPAGQGGNAVLSADVPLQAGQSLTLVAVGRPPELSALPLQDDNAAPPAGKAKVRFVHTSPDAPPVDIAVRGGPTIFPNVGFKSVAGYVTVDAGTYALDVRPAGTSSVALSVPGVILQSGQIVTFFGAGLLNANTLSAVAIDYTVAAGPRVGTGGPYAVDPAVPSWSAGAAVLAAIALVAGVGALRRRHNR